MSNLSVNGDPGSIEVRPLNGSNSTHLYVSVWESLNYTLPTLIVVAVVLFIVIVATAFGNLLVVLALFKYRSLRTISNYLIGNLALSDFLLATTILPLSTVNECLGHWIFGRELCNAWLTMDVLYCTASIWNILFISFDRFTATICPIWYREKRSAKKAAIYIALVWLISCSICLPPVLGWNDLSQNYIYDADQNIYKCNLFQTPSYVLYSACGSFYIPFFMTFFFYMAIFIALRDRMRKTRKARTSTMAAASTRAGAGIGSGVKAGGLTAVKAITDSSSHQKILDKKIGQPKDKSHRLQKEYKLEMASIIDTKKDRADGADENSSKSLFGSDSERERSVSDVETDVITTAMTSQPTHVTFDESVISASAPPHHTNAIERDSIPMNGFDPLTWSSQVKRVDQSGASAAKGRNGGGAAACARQPPQPTDAADQRSSPSRSRISESAKATLALPLPDLTASPSPSAAPSSQFSPAKSSVAVGVGVEGAKSRGRRLPFAKGASSAGAGASAAASASSKRNRRYEQREMRATIRMAIIIAFFCGMWVGFFTVYVLGSWCHGCNIPRELEAFFFWLGYSNSSINPILYTIFNDDFRKAFMQIVGCHVMRKAKR